MATISERFGSGGANVAPGGSAGSPDLATAIRDIADDLAELRTQFILILAKLDDDATVTDTNYEALGTPAALLTTKV